MIHGNTGRPSWNRGKNKFNNETMKKQAEKLSQRRAREALPFIREVSDLLSQGYTAVKVQEKTGLGKNTVPRYRAYLQKLTPEQFDRLIKKGEDPKEDEQLPHLI